MVGLRSPRRPGPDRHASADRGRALLVIVAAAAAVALVAVITLVLLRDDGSAPSEPGAATTPTTSARTPSPTLGPTPSPTVAPTTRRPSAADALSEFFVAAARLDQQLQAAAAAINATGPPWEQISTDVARTVRAADLDPVARAIPAGLPRDLQESVILVLSDLASRRQAMESFTVVAPVLPDATDAAHQTNEQLLAELQNGHAAAVRFDDDLAAARALADAGAPIAAVATESRLTAEVLVLVEYVRVANAGCDQRGGAVLTSLPQVRWGSVSYQPEAEGTVAGAAFEARLRPDGTWEVHLFVC